MFPRICAGSTLSHTCTHTHLTRCRQMRSGCQRKQHATPMQGSILQRLVRQPPVTYDDGRKEGNKTTVAPPKPASRASCRRYCILYPSSSVIFTGLPNYVHIINFFAKATAMRAENPGLIRSVVETEWKFPNSDLIG